MEQVGKLNAGEIGVVTTSDLVLAGDVLGKEKLEDNFNKISQAVLSVQAVAEEEKNYQKLDTKVKKTYLSLKFKLSTF